jgi:hypothetical protein
MMAALLNDVEYASHLHRGKASCVAHHCSSAELCQLAVSSCPCDNRLGPIPGSQSSMRRSVFASKNCRSSCGNSTLVGEPADTTVPEAALAIRSFCPILRYTSTSVPVSSFRVTSWNCAGNCKPHSRFARCRPDRAGRPSLSRKAR